jgi:hypothetical protein
VAVVHATAHKAFGKIPREGSASPSSRTLKPGGRLRKSETIDASLSLGKKVGAILEAPIAGDQTKNWPPLAEMVEPVMNPASSEARKTTQRAISSGSPRRPTGICAMMLSRTFSGTAITISVPI